jgi:putative aldouronate transport system substrate-binding protein
MKRSLMLVATALLCLAPGTPAVFAADAPTTLNVFVWDNAVAPPADNKVYKLIKDKFGITFNWDIAVGGKDQKIGVMIASGDYPDLVELDGPKFIEAKAVIPLEGLIEKYAPNLKKAYAKVWDKLKEKDGHIYVLPNWGVLQGRDQSTYFGDSAMWIQKEVLKEFNYPKVTTVDEYFDLIEKYKKAHPTIDGKPTLGFSILTYDWHVFCLINPPNFLAGNPNDGNGVVDKKTYKYEVFLDKDISKRWFKKLNEMNAKGLIDRNSFVDNYDQYMAKLSSGRVLGIHDQLWDFNDSNVSLLNQGKYSRSMAPLPIVFDKSITPWYRNRPLPNLQRGYAITAKAKDPVRIIKFMDAQISEEWQKIFHWGIKGEDYELDAKGVPYRTPAQRAQQDDAVWKLHNKAELWYSNAPKIEGSFSDGNPSSMGDIPSEYLASVKPEDKELFKAYGVSSFAELMAKDTPENPVYFPAWQLTPADGSDAQVAWKKAEDTFRKFLPRVILAKPADFEKTWKEYTDALGKLNLKAYEDVINQKIAERVKAWGPSK